jgi:hypothetical protein
VWGDWKDEGGRTKDENRKLTTEVEGQVLAGRGGIPREEVDGPQISLITQILEESRRATGW